MKVWTKDEIAKTLGEIATSEREALTKFQISFTYAALQGLFLRQTADEREALSTCHRNGMGFNGTDATFLSDVAKKSQGYGSLTPGQAKAVAKCIRKYAGQLEEIAQAKGAASAAPASPVSPTVEATPVVQPLVDPQIVAQIERDTRMAQSLGYENTQQWLDAIMNKDRKVKKPRQQRTGDLSFVEASESAFERLLVSMRADRTEEQVA